jgi:hypothetical protein
VPEPGGDERQGRVAFGEGTDDPSPSPDLTHDALEWIVGPQAAVMFAGKGIVAVKDGLCSGRAGCRILRLSRSAYWYRAGKRSARQQQLVKRIHTLTDENPRYGYRRIAALLRQEGWNAGMR